MDEALRNKILKEVAKVQNYYWTQVQTNFAYNNAGSFLFNIFDYDKLIEKIRETMKKKGLPEEFEQYTINRWYNFLTQLIVQDFFVNHSRVVAEKNRKSLYVDIFIDGRPFDIKMTPLPKNFVEKFEKIWDDPSELIVWLYKSGGAQRFHADPKIFLVVIDLDDLLSSWKLKRQFDVIEKVVKEYLERTKNTQYFKDFGFRIKKTSYKVSMADLIFIVKKNGKYFGRFFFWKDNNPVSIDVA